MGLEASQSCCARTHNLELERRLHEFVEASLDDKQWRMQTRKRAGRGDRERAGGGRVCDEQGVVQSSGEMRRSLEMLGLVQYKTNV